MRKYTILLLLFLIPIYNTSSQSFGEIPNYNLKDINNNEISDDILSSNVYLINFFFSSCPKICPIINGKISTLTRKFEKLKIISISIDPKRDTIEALKSYSKRFNANKNWHFVTEKKDIINNFIQKINLATSKDPENHSTRIILVNKNKEIKGMYRGLDIEDFKKLETDLNKILKN